MKLPLFALALCVIVAATPVTVLAQPVNTDFEDPTLTSSWYPGEAEHYKAVLETGKAFSGKQFLVMRSVGTPKIREFGNVSQPFEGAPYRGKNVIYSAHLRKISTDPVDAKIWVRIERRAPEHAVFLKSGSMADEKSSAWKELSVSGHVPDDAEHIYLGFALEGEGAVGIDAVKFEAASSGAGNKIALPKLPDFITVLKVGGGTQNIQTADIASIVGGKTESTIVLKDGHEIKVSGDYSWLENEMKNYR